MLKHTTEYAFPAALFLFFLAWIFYDVDLDYAIKKWAHASEELNQKREMITYQNTVSKQHLEMGNTFLNSGKYEEAEKVFKRALELNANAVLAEYGLLKSRLLDMNVAGDYDPQVIAIRIEAVRNSNPHGVKSDPHVDFAEAKLLHWSGNNPIRSEKLLRTAINSERNYTAAKIQLGSVLLAQGKYEGAVRFLEEARRKDSLNVDIYNNLSYAYELQLKIDTAYALQEKAWRIDPHDIGTLVGVFRINLVYNEEYKYVSNSIPSVIDQLEKNKLHTSPGNRTRRVGHVWKGRIRSLGSWESKKAYLNQLAMLSETLENDLNDVSELVPELKRLWQSSLEGWEILPLFLYHDLELMIQHHKTNEPLKKFGEKLMETARDHSRWLKES